jgi:hypothetical protein
VKQPRIARLLHVGSGETIRELASVAYRWFSPPDRSRLAPTSVGRMSGKDRIHLSVGFYNHLDDAFASIDKGIETLTEILQRELVGDQILHYQLP